MNLHHIILNVFIASFIGGCGTSPKSPKWCSISAKIESGDSESPVFYSLMFEDYESTLMTRLLQCGTQDYLMSQYANSKSTDVLPKPQYDNFMKWNGVLACKDLKTAYPHDSQNSTDVLVHLCTLEGQKGSQSAASPSPVGGEEEVDTKEN
jgi:hypothetical protein